MAARVRKLRGGKRYYAKLRKRAETFGLDLSESHWYDLWHEHFDRWGYSRVRLRIRRRHLMALFAAFKRALQQAALTPGAVQIFVSIAPASEAQQDALYVHTPNPNGTRFPHQFDGFRWDAAPPAFLREFVNAEEWQVGSSADGWWVVRPRQREW